VVFGGVFTPLVAVGYFEGFFHPVIAVLFIVAGIFTFYQGWLGQYVLTVNEGQGHVDFPVEDPGENLMAFIDFTNQYIENEPLELRSLFLLIGSEDKSLTIKEIALRDPPFELFTFRQLKERFLSDPGISEAVTWAIDPLRTGSQVRYQRVKDDGRLRPVLSGRIIPEAILRKYTRDEFMAISPENKNY
ncbi:MAG: hypothetical protein KFF73_03205, partial [Cyclobacteriaceae bacterium]|nr:hypothetical protein [Cyclobacteriaceae bacterium]